MKLNEVEKAGIVFWIIIPAFAIYVQKETATEWVVCTLYVAASVLSMLDVAIANKALTVAAVAAWLALILIGAAIEYPATFSSVAWLIRLDRHYDGNGLVIGGAALVSLLILGASLHEEVTKGK